jgi:DNA-binding beta-propeller fold protein YncE
VSADLYPITVNATALAIDPSGQYIYVSNYLYPGAAFSINSATGALTPVVGGAFDLAAFASASGYSVAILSLL